MLEETVPHFTQQFYHINFALSQERSVINIIISADAWWVVERPPFGAKTSLESLEVTAFNGVKEERGK